MSGHGSPNPDSCKNFPHYFTMGWKTALRGSQGHSVPRAARQRIPALARALEFQALLDAGTLNTRADIARRYGVSRARVTQVMRLLKPHRAPGVIGDVTKQDGLIEIPSPLKRGAPLPRES